MNGNSNEALIVEEMSNSKGNGTYKGRTTIGLKSVTKKKLDENRAPGQCYDGFIWQLVNLWERTNSNRK